VIQISPQPETFEAAGAEYLRKPEYSSSAEIVKNEDDPGAFAAILAALLEKPETGNPENPAGSGTEDSFSVVRDSAGEDSRLSGAGAAGKNGRNQGSAAARGRDPEDEAPDGLLLGKSGKAGETSADFPAEEILFGPEYLLRPAAGKTLAGEDGVLAEQAPLAEDEAAGNRLFADKRKISPEERLKLADVNETLTGETDKEAGLSGGLFGAGLSGAFHPEGGADAVETPVREIRGEDTGNSLKRAFRDAAEETAGGELAEAENRRFAVKKPAGPDSGRNGGKLEEARREKRRNSLEVHDLRSEEARAESAKSGGETLKAAEPGETRDITVELRSALQHRDAPSSAETNWETRSGRAVEDLLARELHQNLNSDIVRHASILLRDGGEGTIRLSLKPESLGNVKIRLEMAENKITGYIVVESEEALRAFEREISSLEQAFRDSGFQGADLEMSLAAGGGGADRRPGREETAPFLSGRGAASRYEVREQVDAADTGVSGAYQRGRNFINVLA
jgi:hypothetical protein